MEERYLEASAAASTIVAESVCYFAHLQSILDHPLILTGTFFPLSYWERVLSQGEGLFPGFGMSTYNRQMHIDVTLIR